MATIDRLVLLSTILFGTAGLLVLISISRPRWILSKNEGKQRSKIIHQELIIFSSGETSIGLIEMCITTSASNFAHQQCFIPHHVRSVWIISFALAIGAVGLLTLTVLLLLASQYTQATTIEYGRLTGFIASV